MATTMKRSSLLNEQDDSSRSERLLRNMHKVFCHDLPNQMVALQSLLQLLNTEESDRLSGDGREYLRRLQNAARRAGEMVRFLKEMDRVSAFHCRADTIALSVMARELQGELKRLHPATEYVFEWHWHAPAVHGDSRVFLAAILELSAGLVSTQTKHCSVQATSQVKGDSIELAFRFAESAATQSGAATPRECMEIILAREWLALCGAVVDVTILNSAETAFRIVVPNR